MKINLLNPVSLNEKEIEYIRNMAQKEAEEKGEEILYINVWEEDGELCFQPIYKRKIKRVRRITGYFSEINNFNDAKKAEVRDRVAHN